MYTLSPGQSKKLSMHWALANSSRSPGSARGQPLPSWWPCNATAPKFGDFLHWLPAARPGQVPQQPEVTGDSRSPSSACRSTSTRQIRAQLFERQAKLHPTAIVRYQPSPSGYGLHSLPVAARIGLLWDHRSHYCFRRGQSIFPLGKSCGSCLSVARSLSLDKSS